MTKLILFRQKFQSLPIEERKQFIKNLNTAQRLSLYLYPEFFLFDKQIITGTQRYTILRCGRSFGKSFTGSAWIARKVLDGAKDLGLVGPTLSDVENVMVKAVLKWFPKGEARYTGGTKKLITFKKYPDTTIYCYSADTEIRGPNLEFLWCDEIVKWNDAIAEKVEETFDVADFAVRIGKNPQTLITSTPKPFPLFIKWDTKIKENNSLYKMYTGTMFDNPFLSDSYKQAMIDKFGSGRLGKQELYGELLTDTPGAAWTHKMIDDCKMSFEDFKNKLSQTTLEISERGVMRKSNKFEIIRCVVGVDPTVSDKPDGDECGIIIGCLASDGHVYILNDYSGQFTTYEWARQSLKALDDYDAGMILIEDNIGKATLIRNIRALDNHAPIKPVGAYRGKIDRALPIAALYERGLVHHVMPRRNKDQTDSNFNYYSKLEDQMTHFTGNPKLKSPDRLDALVHCVQELMLTATYIDRDVSAIGSF